MITFYQHIEEIKRAYDISSAPQIASIKRWYNLGAKKIRTKLIRQVNTDKMYASLVAYQQSYQMPEFAGRVRSVKYNETGNEWPLVEVASNQKWDALNSGGGQSGIPTHYHLSGDDTIELWPTPSAAVTNGLAIECIFRQPMLTADDVETGTATVTNGSQVVTLSSGVVDQKWVGRYFKTTNGSHEIWYRIVEYVSSTSFKLENLYEGIGGSSQSYIVGDMVDLPEDALDLLETFVVSKYLGIYRKDRAMAKDMMEEFKDGIKDLRQEYATSGSSRVVKASRHRLLDTPYPRWWPVNGLSE